MRDESVKNKLRMECKADGNASGNVAKIKDYSREKNTG